MEDWKGHAEMRGLIDEDTTKGAAKKLEQVRRCSTLPVRRAKLPRIAALALDNEAMQEHVADFEASTTSRLRRANASVSVYIVFSVGLPREPSADP